MNARELLQEFTKTGQLKYLRDALKELKNFNMTNLDKSDEPCGSCMFHVGRLDKTKSLFDQETLEPSHCFLSNLFSSAYKNEDGKTSSDYVISCFGPTRDNWIEPPNSQKRFKADSMRSDVFDRMFDVPKVFTEMTKFVAALEANEDTKPEEK